MWPYTKIQFSRDGVEIGEYRFLEVERQLKLGTIKVTDDYWHEGMTQWRSVQYLLMIMGKVKKEKEKDDEEIAIAIEKERQKQIPEKKTYSFSERLDQLICLFWFIVNVFLGITAVYLSVKNGFVKNNINVEDYKTGLLVMLFVFLILYALYISIVYLFTGKNLINNENYSPGGAGSHHDFAGVGVGILILQLWIL